MGEVYRARDTRLDRTVAVKVLPKELAADPDLRARFEREARAISALAHPNICTLHDVGEQDGQTFLVMEHLVGQTLAERLKKGPLSLDQALEVATQIGAALAAAHKKGIVHRDLKPANVMLTKTGARLLDFGLARLTGHGDQAAVESLTSAPTKQKPLTGAGIVMGTLPYMAPEQVEGKPADARTDLWALGAILYEMLTGGRAFEASSPTSLVGAILEREPAPLAERQPLTPPSLERLVRRCLAKDPDERWQSALDVNARLREIANPDPDTSRARGTPWWVILALVAAVVTAFVAGVLGTRPWQGTSQGPVVRAEIDLTLERALTHRRPSRTAVALSPDGTHLLWNGRPSGRREGQALYMRSLDSGVVEPIPGTENVGEQFFSPDGRWIGFTALVGDGPQRDGPQRKVVLRKVPINGGLAVDLAEVPDRPMGSSWGRDGKIYLGSMDGGIRWVPAEGGPLREITTRDRSREAGHRLPWALPGGRALLFTTMPRTTTAVARIEAVSLTTGERTVVVEDAADARYLETGHLVFVRRGTLMAAPFDLERLELAAPPVPVVDGVSQALNMRAYDNSGAGQFAVSDSGLLVYAPGGIPSSDRQRELVLLDETGRAEPLPGFDRETVSPNLRFSPDGRQLAFTEEGTRDLVGLFDVERQTYRVLAEGGVATSPRWNPDGSRIAMSWSEGGPFHIHMWPVGGGDGERLTESAGYDWALSWSPDGRFLAFVREELPAHDIVLYRFEDRKVVPFLVTKANEAWPEFSPDGRWLAYGSDETGEDEIYVTSFPDGKQTLAVSSNGGRDPTWSRDGRRLFYVQWRGRQEGGFMMAVSVGPGESLSLGQPTTLFQLPDGFETRYPNSSYAVHPDGRFLVALRREHEPPPPITRLNLVHNWFSELERLAPTDR
jgi:serine/threonine-protein kinase